MALIKLQGIAQQGGNQVVTSGTDSTTTVCQSFPGATITVHAAGTSNLSTIYSDSSSTPKANPFTCSSTDASWFFYVAAGNYDIQFSGTGIATPFTLSDIAVGNTATPSTVYREVYDIQEYADFATALSTLGSSNPATLAISVPTNVTANATVPKNITLWFCNTGYLNLTTGRTLSINGSIESPQRKIFFNAAASQGTISFTGGNPKVDILYPQWWGATGDGATDDFAAIQAAQTALKTAGGGTLKFGRGTYLTSAAIQITEVKNQVWLGTGPDNTRIVATGGTTAVQCNGIWRSRFQGLLFTTNASISTASVFELDGNYDSVHTQGVQGVTFDQCYFDAAQLAGSAFSVCRQGTGSGQGSECLYLNCNFDGGTFSCFNISGSNAVQHTIIGGNFQSFPTNGIYVSAGSVYIFSSAFQSTYGYTQITNDGYDINLGNFGVGERPTIIGCRTESMRFFKNAGSQPGILIGNNSRLGNEVAWNANSAYTLNQIVVKTSPTLGTKPYRVTTAGTSGGLQPTWPDSGTVADGTVVWTELEFNVVLGTLGNLYLANSFEVGNQPIGSYLDSPAYVTAANLKLLGTEFTTPIVSVFADATAGNITVDITSALSPPDGQIVIVKKTDTSANTVTVHSAYGNGIEGGVNDVVIPGGSNGYIIYQYSAQATPIGGRWFAISKSFALAADTLLTKTWAIPGTIGSTTPSTGAFTTLTSTGGALNGTLGAGTPAAVTATTISASGHTTFEGVTSTGATGTGNLVYATNPTVASPIFTSPTLGTATSTSETASSFLKVANTGKFVVAPKTNDTYGASMTIDVTISNHVIAVSNGTSAAVTMTPSAAGSAGDWLFIDTVADGSGTVTTTFAATFHSSGTQATTLSHFSSIAFKSDGTRWIEQYRTTNLV